MMKTKKNSLMMLLASFLFLGCGSPAQEGLSTIDAEQLKKLNTDEVILLDVRTPAEWEQGRIKNAILINYRDSNFREQVAALDSEKPVIVYCAAGGRSTGASKVLQDAGFKTIYNYTGGFSDWKSKGEEIIK
ncbi:MAG: rhodanese-like domain-containing protein [Cyclobacteriaceae bacterium]